MGTQRKPVLLWVLLGLIGAAMLAGFVSILMPRRFVDDKVYASVLIVGLHALGAMVLVSLRTPMRRTMQLAMMGLGGSMLLYLLAVWLSDWLSYRTEDALVKMALLSLLLGLMLMHRLLICPLRPSMTGGRAAQVIALWSGPLFVGLVLVGMGFERLVRFDGVYIRLVGLAGILVAGSSIAVWVMALMGPKAGDEEPGLLGGSVDVALTCPRCGTGVVARANRECRCDGCRLKVRVQVREPRCACGYLLYQLESDACPECGAGVPEQERWSAGESLGDGHAPA